MNNEDINRLIAEAVDGLGVNEIYNLSLCHVDFKRLREMEPITQEEFAKNSAIAGFIAGMKYTLENFDFDALVKETEE